MVLARGHEPEAPEEVHVMEFVQGLINLMITMGDINIF
jgi:hypothetical protein